MPNAPKCPKCDSEDVYENGGLWICPDCEHEWSAYATEKPTEIEQTPEGVRDAHGNALATGDSVTVIKDLKVKGSSLVVKGGTKVKNIRIVDGHNISSKLGARLLFQNSPSTPVDIPQK